jgi:hypothetical protein
MQLPQKLPNYTFIRRLASRLSAVTSIYRSKRDVILFLFLLTALSHWIVTPIFEIYDEGAHMGYIWALRQTQQLPVYNNQIPASEQLYGQEASQAPLYYILATILSLPASVDDFRDYWQLNPHAQVGITQTTHNRNWFIHDWTAESFPWRGTVLAVHLARLLSVGLAVSTLLLLHRLAQVVSLGNTLLADVALAFVAFNPTFAHLAAGVNNDWLVIALCTLALLKIAGRIRAPAQANWRNTLFLALTISAAILSKLGGLLLLPLFLWLIVWEWRQKRYALSEAFKHLLLLGTVVGVLTGWWFVRNFALYGDPTATVVHLWHWEVHRQRSLYAILFQESWGVWLSFWGVFGAFSFTLPDWCFAFINLIGLVSLTGLVLKIARQPGKVLNPLGGLLLLWALLVLVGFIRWTVFLSASQGRLLYPAMAAWAIGAASGYVAWSRWLPARAFQALLYTAFGGLALISLAVPWVIMKPGYTPPRTEVVSGDVPSRLQRSTAITFGDAILLKGVTVDSGCRGSASDVESVHRLYAQADKICTTVEIEAQRPLDHDYSFSIQIMAPSVAQTPLAQIDTYPGSGLLPTSLLASGKQLLDSYELPIHSVLTHPTEAVLQFVVYDFQTGERLPAIDLTSGERYSGDAVGLATLQLMPSTLQDVPEQARISPVQFGESLELRGVEIAFVGEQWQLLTYWHALQDIQQNWQLFVHRSDSPTSAPVAAYDHLLGGDEFPSNFWQAGDVIIDRVVLTNFPFPESIYLGIYDPASGVRLPALQNGEHLEADALSVPVVPNLP